MLFRGVAAGVEHEKILNSLTINTVIDVGANRGQFALVASCCFPFAKIISFEPLKSSYLIFKKIFRNNANINIYNIAVGDREAEIPIHISNHDDSSSLLPIGKLQTLLFPGTNEKKTEIIKMQKLYNLLNKAELQKQVLLKIDVQGYELKVLEGCDDLLELIKYVYIECSFLELYDKQALAHEVISFLEKRGFRLAGVYNVFYNFNGISIQGDFLFARETTK